MSSLQSPDPYGPYLCNVPDRNPQPWIVIDKKQLNVQDFYELHLAVQQLLGVPMLNDPFGVIAFIVFVITGCCMLITWVQSHRLWHNFKTNNPEIVKQFFPDDDNFQVDPERYLFFFRKRSIPYLIKDDKIWRLRQQVKFFSYLSLILPLSFITIGLIFIIIVQFILR